jgi:[ribosomal protein S18]-alanine N-acetyltransferase
VDFRPRPIDDASAEAVASWRYPGVYAFYDLDRDPDDVVLIRDADRREGRWFAVDDAGSGELVGFFELKPRLAEVEIGLGLRPDLTGRGLGGPFVAAGIALARERHPGMRVFLLVAVFNDRARKVYERAGFRARGTQLLGVGGEAVEFIEMELPEPGSERPGASRPLQ